MDDDTKAMRDIANALVAQGQRVAVFRRLPGEEHGGGGPEDWEPQGGELGNIADGLFAIAHAIDDLAARLPTRWSY